LAVAAKKHMTADRAARWMERQEALDETFRKGDWSIGEDVVELVFDKTHRPGGRAGRYTYRIVASRIESNAKW
jgi:hypothetical protein